MTCKCIIIVIIHTTCSMCVYKMSYRGRKGEGVQYMDSIIKKDGWYYSLHLLV